MNKKTPFLLALVCSSAALPEIDAAATRVAYVDPFATARGNAFVATADNPSAVFYNAAGLTQLEGTQLQGNVFAISLGYEFEGAAGNDGMDDDFQPIPSFFLSHSFENAPFSIGFGAYAPFALGSDWGSDASFTAPSPALFPFHRQACPIGLTYNISNTMRSPHGKSQRFFQ
jgi:long-chain fatty acid transport protein